MSRKGLFAGLMDPQLPAGNTEVQGGSKTAPPIFAGGAIGAVSRSIEQIRSQGVSDLEPGLIDASGIVDRLEGEPGAHAEMVASIREHGQQVPILVRPHPEKAGRFQIAYGRRRLKAIAELGRKVRAIVKPLSDQELVVAQGQENSARTDLSFIEKALFAARLEEGGYGRDTIMAALTVDKFGLSRLISSAVKIPRDVVEAIGPAPKAGRDRWVALASRLEDAVALKRARTAIGGKAFAEKSSDDRFAAILVAASESRATTSVAPCSIVSAEGDVIATLKEDRRGVAVSFARTDAREFGAYLAKALPGIYEAFRKGGSMS